MANAKLREAIAEKFKSESACARAMNWPRQKLNKTIHSLRSPKISDLNDLSRVLGKTVGEVISFFEQ